MEFVGNIESEELNFFDLCLSKMVLHIQLAPWSQSKSSDNVPNESGHVTKWFCPFLKYPGIITRSLNKKPHLAAVIILHIAKGCFYSTSYFRDICSQVTGYLTFSRRDFLLIFFVLILLVVMIGMSHKLILLFAF